MKQESKGHAQDTPVSIGALDYLTVAAGFALVASVGELLLLARRKFLLGKVLSVSPQASWMIPAANLLIFLVPALVLLLLARRWPGLRTYRGATLVWGFACFAALALMLSSVHPAAALLLGAGLAWQLARWSGRQPNVVRRIFRVVTPLLLSVMVLLGTVTNVQLARLDRRLRAERGEAAAGAPNILLIIWDTVRSASLQLHGLARDNTPNLERLAARGVTFNRAYATAPWTLPTHASLFTGRPPGELQVGFRDQPLDTRFLTLAEYLGRRGYATGGFVANVLYTDREHGLARGFQHYEDYRVTFGQLLLSSSIGRRLLNGNDRFELSGPLRALRNRGPGRKNASMVTNGFLAWLDRQSGTPFFAFLNYFDAHLPYAPPDSMARAFLQDITVPSRIELAKQGWRRAQPAGDVLVYEQRLYEAAIAHLDAELARLLSELAERGLLENTIVVVTSDHGEEFGEAGHTGHASSVNVWQTHVPLVIAYERGVASGVRVDQPVSLRDVPATIAQLLGDVGAPFPGASLGAAWQAGSPFTLSPAVAELHVPGSARETAQAIRHGAYSYQRTRAGEELLFRLDDIGEQSNLEGAERSADAISSLSQLLPPLPRAGRR